MADFRRVFTASGNPHKNTQPNQLFQADLDKDCLVDELFKRTPTVDALARLVSARITLWQKDKAFNDKRYEASSRDDVSEAPSKKPRHDENSRKAPILPLFRLPTIDATAAVIRATSVAIAVTPSSPTSTPRVPGRARRPTRRSWRGCRRRVLLMSTQSYPAMAAHRTMISERRRTRSASVAPVRSRSTATRNETDPPLRRGRRLRHLVVSTDPQTRPIARPLDAVVSAYDLPCNHARHNLPAPYVNATILI